MKTYDQLGEEYDECVLQALEAATAEPFQQKNFDAAVKRLDKSHDAIKTAITKTRGKRTDTPPESGDAEIV